MKYIVGVDEVGRGSWAGPVVACAFALPVDMRPKKQFLKKLRDSKKLSAKQREEHAKKLTEFCRSGQAFFFIGQASPATIDRINIRQANREAMIQAFDQLFAQIDMNDVEAILIDGNDKYAFPNIDPEKVRYIIRGDDSVQAIQAASILAKVYRDALMVWYADVFPGYGFEKHKGYGTAWHLLSLQTLWITEIHRQSYAPVKARKDLISPSNAL